MASLMDIFANTILADITTSISATLAPMVLAAGGILGMVTNILWVALGLGLVIFFHELGHFAVAKWCNVKVERFSIGFGPVIWSKVRGETEYALSAIPFGGYVKMLGQDDMDPSQMSSEEIAEDPRSYSAKTVPQRMAIISAGVIMNIVTGMIFFAIAFRSGVMTSPSVLGGTQPGRPAWVAGFEYGDRITKINDREIRTFGDIQRGVALTNTDLTITKVSQDGEEVTRTLSPDESGSLRMIGAAPMYDSLKLYEPEDLEESLVWPGSAADEAKAAFKPGDDIRGAAIAGETQQPITDIFALKKWMTQSDVRQSAIDIYVKREGELLDTPITIPPTRFRTLGLSMEIGAITAIVDDSPAAKAGLKIGDKITHVDGKAVGTEIDPLELPDYFYSRRPGGENEMVDVEGEPVTGEVVVTVSRTLEKGAPQEVKIRVTPDDKPGWATLPIGANIPLDVPAIGVAYHMIPYILDVEEGSPAAEAGIEPNERIKKLVLLKPTEANKEILPGDEDQTIEFGEKEDGKPVMNWMYAFRLMQLLPQRDVQLTVIDAKGETREVTLTPQASDDWFLPDFRGMKLQSLPEEQQADNVAAAIGMGFTHTKNSAIDIYLTLRNLLTNRISPTKLSGPVGIATVAYKVAKSGLPELMLFLGFLSVNLAVVNFLPIPVLDGGHMVFLIWEGVTRRKPSERVLQTAQTIGLLFIVGLMLFVLYLDIFYKAN